MFLQEAVFIRWSTYASNRKLAREEHVPSYQPVGGANA
jgi:hypothetical protein